MGQVLERRENRDEASRKQGRCLGPGDLSNLLAFTTATLICCEPCLRGFFLYLVSCHIFHIFPQVFIVILPANIYQYVCAFPFVFFAIGDF